MRDASESEETANREGSAHNQDEDILEASRNEEGIQDDESDNEYTFNEPETESDSDDNQSNQDAQRSVQTGATVGSETGLEIDSFYTLYIKQSSILFAAKIVKKNCRLSRKKILRKYDKFCALKSSPMYQLSRYCRTCLHFQ